MSQVISFQLETVISDTDEVFFSSINSAAIHKNGDIIVSDSKYEKFFVFDSHGNYKTKIGFYGRGPAEFLSVSKIETDINGFIFAYDTKNRRISIWNDEYNYVTDFQFMGGWNTSFKTNGNHVFVWTSPNGVKPNGMRRYEIHKIKKEPWRVELFREFEYEDWRIGHEFLDTWSNFAITTGEVIFATGGHDSNQIYKFDDDDNPVMQFGLNHSQVIRSDKEHEQRIEAARAVSTQYAAMLENAKMEKPFFTDVSIYRDKHIFVHRNKEFGARDEIDVYTLNGEFVTTVTLPPTENELDLLGVYREHILFRVTNSDGHQSVHVYRVEYE